MASQCDISVIICTYQRPAHLCRCLLSLAAQRGVEGRFEVIVTDDGSRDETADVVAHFGRHVDFPVQFITHPHEGFQQARNRNDGVHASQAPYLLFIDGDCLLPPDHLAQQLAARRPGVTRAGDCYRLDEATSAMIDDHAVQSGAFVEQTAHATRRWRRKHHRKALFNQLWRSRIRPKLIGWSMAMWRSDLERVNGFDQRFRAWGCEDDDLRARLQAAGVSIRTTLGYTFAYHLWHLLHDTTPHRWSDGGNVPYLMRPVRLSKCLLGLRRRNVEELAIRCVASDEHAALARQIDSKFNRSTGPLELELLFWPAPEGFSRRADHRILLADNPQTVPAVIKRRANATIVLGARPTADSVVCELLQAINGPLPPGNQIAA